MVWVASLAAVTSASSSSYETDSDDDDDDDDDSGAQADAQARLHLGVCARDGSRREEAEKVEEAANERRAQHAARRKEESRAMLIEAVRRDETGEADHNIEFAPMIDDGDGVDELEEFDTWKVRELKRVRREREERAAAEREELELERRRNLSDAERAAEDEEFRKGAPIMGKRRPSGSTCKVLPPWRLLPGGRRDGQQPTRPRNDARRRRADGQGLSRRQARDARTDAGQELRDAIAGQVDTPCRGGHVRLLQAAESRGGGVCGAFASRRQQRCGGIGLRQQRRGW